jgi:hypothetical protein
MEGIKTLKQLQSYLKENNANLWLRMPGIESIFIIETGQGRSTYIQIKRGITPASFEVDFVYRVPDVNESTGLSGDKLRIRYKESTLIKAQHKTVQDFIGFLDKLQGIY